MMKNFRNALLSLFIFAAGMMFLAGCATAPKNLEPVTAADDATPADFLGRMDILEQPELEADWADWVKARYPNWRTHYWIDRGLWGNRGYIVGSAPGSDEAVPDTEFTPLPPAPGLDDEAPLAILEDEPEPDIVMPAEPTTYTVQKGDSLWKIAGRVYGNPLKWPLIYRANKDKIQNPHRIYPNQVLVIPRD